MTNDDGTNNEVTTSRKISTKKMYYKNPRLFIMFQQFEVGNDDFLIFLEDLQEKFLELGLTSKILINTEVKLRIHNLNHCFLCSDKMDLEGWEVYGSGIEYRILIKKLGQTVDEFISLFDNYEPNEYFELFVKEKKLV